MVYLKLDELSISGTLEKRIQNAEEVANKDSFDDSDTSYNPTIIHCILIVGCCILFSAPTIIMPLHDTIRYPEYWYEGMINFDLTFPIHWTCLIYLDAKTLHKVDSISSFWPCLRIYAICIFAYDVSYTLAYLVWTFVQELNWPVPHAMQIFGYPAYMVFLTSVWYHFPRSMRSNQEEKRKIRAYICFYLWFIVMTIQYTFFNKLFESLQSKWQWVLAFILPLVAMINKNVIKKLATKCAACDDLYTTAYANVTLGSQHSLFIAIAIGSLATQTTIYCLFLSKFLIDLLYCYKIMKIQQRVIPGADGMEQIIERRDKAVATLALAEIMEVLVPMIYGINLTIAYYGPNSTVLGNIGNGYWQYRAMTDLTATLKSVSMMFLVDLISGILIGMALKLKFSINLFKICHEMIQKYWPLMAIKIATLTARVIY